MTTCNINAGSGKVNVSNRYGGAEGEDVEIFITEVEEGTVGGLILIGMVLNMMRAWELKGAKKVVSNAQNDV